MENLKNGTKIKSHDEYEYEYIFKDETFWDIGNTEMLVSDLMGYNFEILSEEDEEIDIQSIEKLPSVDDLEACEPNEYNIQLLGTRYNELLKAIKQLDLKIKEKE